MSSSFTRTPVIRRLPASRQHNLPQLFPANSSADDKKIVLAEWMAEAVLRGLVWGFFLSRRVRWVRFDKERGQEIEEKTD